MKKHERRKPTFAEAIIPLIAMFLILSVGYGVCGFPKEAMLVLSAVVTAGMAFYLGATWEEMIETVSEKIAKAMPTILILLAVGIIISSWMLSGTIPMMIYYGIQIVNPKFFYVTAFIICAVISTCTGTSWGSIGTIGVVLVIIARGVGLAVPITAGAVVAGSYFGDKMSPLSDTTNLAPLAAGSTLYEHIRHMFYTTVPAAIGAIIIYTLLGLKAGTDTLPLCSYASESSGADIPLEYLVADTDHHCFGRVCYEKADNTDYALVKRSCRLSWNILPGLYFVRFLRGIRQRFQHGAGKRNRRYGSPSRNHQPSGKGRDEFHAGDHTFNPVRVFLCRNYHKFGMPGRHLRKTEPSSKEPFQPNLIYSRIHSHDGSRDRKRLPDYSDPRRAVCGCLQENGLCC